MFFKKLLPALSMFTQRIEFPGKIGLANQINMILLSSSRFLQPWFTMGKCDLAPDDKVLQISIIER